MDKPKTPSDNFFCNRKAAQMSLKECVDSFINAESYGHRDNPCRRCWQGRQNCDSLTPIQFVEKPAATAPVPMTNSMAAAISEHNRFLAAIAKRFAWGWFSAIDLRGIGPFNDMSPRDRLALLSDLTQANCVTRLGNRYMVRECVLSELERRGDI